ncbi:putative peptidase [Planococcus massiliensis]|uniref:Putative peptidase n=1 Tax=Planococcus massiliensis TaxID=1499687 RepID=A0A098EGK5_9BACL|nr:M23 family metallopeptidase [Planococcus massiliensis]CEG21439.1 putative peptidase [Planococcus massiliensis]
MGRGRKNGFKPEEFGEHFLAEDFTAIYRQCIKEFRETIALRDFIELAKSFNRGVKGYHLAFETTMPGFKQYIWLDDRKEKAINVSFDGNEIQGMYIKPYVTYPKSDNQVTKTEFIMPIADDWFVFWGGKNEFINYHYAYEQQRYAYDLVVMKAGQTYRNQGLRNEDYYAFSKKVVAPAGGKVIEVVDGIRDNPLGEMNESDPAGNFIVLEHGQGEYSLLAHFKKETIRVKSGDSVEQGQLLGLCGNSGNSSEAHIHFQVMDSPEMEQSSSLNIRFKGGIEPIQGDTVHPAVFEKNKQEFDTFDKAETAFSLAGFFQFIPRLIGYFFK